MKRLFLIAGLMTAITLRAQGHSCNIYERTRQGHETGHRRPPRCLPYGAAQARCPDER